MEPGRDGILRQKQRAFIGRMLACFPDGIQDRLSVIRESADSLGGLIKQEQTWSREDSEEFNRILSTIEKQVTILSGENRYLERFARRLDRTSPPFNPAEIVEEAVSFSGRYARMRQVELTLNVEKKVPDIQSDPLRIFFIVTVIINDMLEYVKRGGKAVIELDRTDSEALIKVRSQGAPDSADHSPKGGGRYLTAAQEAAADMGARVETSWNEDGVKQTTLFLSTATAGQDL